MDYDDIVLTYDMFTKETEYVKFMTGSYQEVITHADSRTLMFQARAKPTWKSSLENLPRTVKGLTQKLVRLYDCNRDIFGFVKEKVEVDLTVRDILNTPPVWQGEELTSLNVFDLCDQMINLVI